MYRIRREVGNSHVDSDGKLTLGAAVDFMQDCSGFQLDSEKELSEYFRNNNVTMFLISRQINLHKPVMYGERVDIITTIYQLKNSYGFRNTNIYDEEGNVRISSYAGGAFVDLAQGKATTVPKELLADFQLEEKFKGMDYLPRKIRLPNNSEPEKMDAVKVRGYHIDKNRHMNNSAYLRIAQEYLDEDFNFNTVRIEYKTAAKKGDMITPCVFKQEGGIYVISLQDESGDVFANIEFRE